jgi:hypothetical protein
MRVVLFKGMVNIDSDNFQYGNIRNMYTENRNGAGLQLDTKLEDRRDDINEICDKIANLLYQLSDIDDATMQSQAHRTNEQ